MSVGGQVVYSSLPKGTRRINNPLFGRNLGDHSLKRFKVTDFNPMHGYDPTFSPPPSFIYRKSLRYYPQTKTVVPSFFFYVLPIF